MTREKAIFYIKELQKTYASMDKKVAEAVDMAIEALKENKLLKDENSFLKQVLKMYTDGTGGDTE